MPELLQSDGTGVENDDALDAEGVGPGKMTAHGVRIPKVHLEVLEWLSAQDVANIGDFVSVLGKVTDPSATSLASALDEAGLSADPSSSTLVDLLMGLSLFRYSHSESVDAVANDMARSESLDIDTIRRDRLFENLRRLLSDRAIVVASRATDLLGEQEKSLHSARIFTESRPLFAADDGGEVVGFVVYHSAKLEYYESGEYVSIHVAFDGAGLARLRAAVEAAQAREVALRDSFRNLGVSVIEPGEE